MNSRKLVRLISVMTVVGIAVALSSMTGRDCKETLGAILQKQDAIATPKGNQVYFMHTLIETEGVRQGYTKSEVKMLVGEKKVVFRSSPLNYYKDDLETYTIIHPQKLITKSTSQQPKKEMQQRQQQVTLLRDSIFENCKLVACTQVLLQGKTVTKITVAPKQQSKLPIAQMVYYVNEKKQQVVKQEIYYLAGAALTKKTTTYLALDLNSKQRFLPTAKDYIYENGKLRQELADYTLE
jgi:hypothetical protein